MVLQNRVYATSDAAKKQTYVPQRQKDFLERHILRKREEARRHQDFWTGTVQHFSKLEHEADRFSGLVSEEVRRASLNASKKEEEEARRRTSLASRRERLGALLAAEDSQMKAEMARLPREERNIQDIRQLREEFRKQREEEQRKEAELKMLQHWRINNPRAREVTSARTEASVRRAWEQQIEERRLEKERISEVQAAEERARAAEEERRRQAHEAEEVKRRERLAEWRTVLEQQLSELRAREREAAESRRLAADQAAVQQQVEAIVAEREHVERVRSARVLAEYQERQHKVQLGRRVKEVQQELEEDRQRLHQMEQLVKAQEEVELAKRERAVKEVRWMQDVLKRQLEEEARRKVEVDLLYAEEAEQMAAKQEEVWAREAAARQRLMAEVTASWRQENQARLEEAKAREQEVIRQGEELRLSVDQLTRAIQEEETRRQEQQMQFRAGLNEGMQEKERRSMEERLRDQEGDIRRRMEEIREENRLARELALWNIGSPTVESADFRRKKVRWYY